MQVRIAREALERMRAAAAAAAPEECCGLLLGRENRIEEARPTANIAEDRRRRFEIDPQALVDAHRAERAGGLRVAGYYHSHPAGPEAPSATDRALSARDGSVWAIVANGDVSFWRDGEERFERLSYTVEDR